MAARCGRGRVAGRAGRAASAAATGIFELMVNNELIKELIGQRVNSGVIRHEALKAGMITLRQDGWRKVLNGTTTIDEVSRVTAGDIS